MEVFVNYFCTAMRKIFLIFISCILVSGPFYTTKVKADTSHTVSLVAALSAGILGYKALKHTFQLDSYNIVERAYRNNTEKDFLFGAYLYDKHNFTYPADISEHRKEMQEAINKDIRLPNKLYVYDIDGLRIDPKQVTKKQLQEAVAHEQEKLEKTMRAVAGYTDAPEKILNWYAHNKAESIHNGSHTEKIDLWPIDRCINLIKTDIESDNKDFVYDKSFMADIYGALELSWPEYIKKEIWFTPCYRPLTWVTGQLSFTWAIGTRYNKATKMFADLVSIYSRLLTIKSIVDSKEFKLDKVQKEKTKQTTINDAKEIVTTLSSGIETLHIHRERTDWIRNFLNLIRLIKELNEDYRLDVAEISSQIHLIETSIYTEKDLTETHVIENLRVYLQNITRALDTISK